MALCWSAYVPPRGPRMSIHVKVILALLSLAAIGISGFAVGMRSMAQVKQSLDEIIEVATSTEKHTKEATKTLNYAHRIALETLRVQQIPAIAQRVDHFESLIDTHKLAIESLKSSVNAEEALQALASSVAAEEVFSNTTLRMFEAHRARLLTKERLQDQINEFESTGAELSKTLLSLTVNQENRIQEVEDTIDFMEEVDAEEISDLVNTLFQYDYTGLKLSKDLTSGIALLNVIARQYLDAVDPEFLKKARERYAQQAEQAMMQLAVLVTVILDAKERQLVLALQEAFETWMNETLATGQLFDSHDQGLAASQEAKRLSVEMSQSASRLTGSIAEVSRLSEQISHQADARAALVVKESRALMLVVLGVMLVATTVVATGVFLHLSRPLRRITQTMGRLSENDLQISVPHHLRKDEIGQMAKAVLVFRDNAIKVQELDALARRQEAENRHLDELAKQQEQAQAERQREMLGELGTAFGDVVRAANEGDFERQVTETQFTDEALKRLANAVNSLLLTVSTGINACKDILESLAEGDLTQKMRGHFSGAFAELQSYANYTTERLSELLSNIAKASQVMISETDEIAKDALDLSQRTEEQAAALEETLGALKEISDTVNANALSASQAADFATQADDEAGEGVLGVEATNLAMQAIQNSAREVSETSSMIQEIAFQTNILALNASAEAARSGEGGRGFKVVAFQVRDLALNSSEAANRISELTKSSAELVDSGAERVQQTGETFDKIAQRVKEVTLRMREISDEAEIQAMRIQGIQDTMAQMDDTTQRNATSAEKNAALAQGLSQRAQELAKQVSEFKLNKV